MLNRGRDCAERCVGNGHGGEWVGLGCYRERKRREWAELGCCGRDVASGK